jgi:hypothetical protein
MADGATYEEAVVNAQTVIQEWIETARELGRDIPAPKGGSSSPEARPELRRSVRLKLTLPDALIVAATTTAGFVERASEADSHTTVRRFHHQHYRLLERGR